MKSIVSCYTNYNYNNYLGVTALIRAAVMGHLQVVTYLLAHGSSVKENNDDGKSKYYLPVYEVNSIHSHDFFIYIF